jgi:hypothetical protein
MYEPLFHDRYEYDNQSHSFQKHWSMSSPTLVPDVGFDHLHLQNIHNLAIQT